MKILTFLINIGTYDFWILKISATGTLIWEKSFGGTEIDEPRAITTTNDGNFIVVGDTRSSDTNVSTNNGAADLWMIKLQQMELLFGKKHLEELVLMLRVQFLKPKTTAL